MISREAKCQPANILDKQQPINLDLQIISLVFFESGKLTTDEAVLRSYFEKDFKYSKILLKGKREIYTKQLEGKVG